MAYQASDSRSGQRFPGYADEEAKESTTEQFAQNTKAGAYFDYRFDYNCQRTEKLEPTNGGNIFWSKYGDYSSVAPTPLSRHDDSKTALYNGTPVKSEGNSRPGNNSYALTSSERIDVYLAARQYEAPRQVDDLKSTAKQVKLHQNYGPPPLSAHIKPKYSFFSTSYALQQAKPTYYPLQQAGPSDIAYQLNEKQYREFACVPTCAQATQYGDLQAQQVYSQGTIQNTQAQKSQQTALMQSNVLYRVVQIPLRFTRKMADVVHLDGTPFIYRLFAAQFYSQQIKMLNGAYECVDYALQQQINSSLAQKVPYYEYMVPAIIAEYLARGAEVHQIALQIDADSLVFASYGRESSLYNVVFVDAEKNGLDRDNIANKASSVSLLLSKGDSQSATRGILKDCGRFFLLELEAGIDSRCLGFELDKGAFFNGESSFLASLGAYLKDSDSYTRIKPLQRGYSASLEVLVAYKYVGAYIYAVERISSRASTVANFALLLGLQDGPIQQQLATARVQLSQHTVEDAVTASKNYIHRLQQCGKIAQGSIDEQINVSTSVLSSSIALLQCRSDGNPTLTACLTLWSLAYAYRQQGAVLCCACTAKEAAKLAINAFVFDMARCAVYFCASSDPAAYEKAVPISLPRIIQQNIQDGTYVGNQLTADENAHVVELIIAYQFDAWMDGQKYKEIEQLELQSCAILITTSENLTDKRLDDKLFAASFVFEADKLLESECMLPISRAPNHVVLTARERCYSPELINLQLQKANFGRSLFKRLVDMGLPTLKVTGAALVSSSTYPSPSVPMRQPNGYKAHMQQMSPPAYQSAWSENTLTNMPESVYNTKLRQYDMFQEYENTSDLPSYEMLSSVVAYPSSSFRPQEYINKQERPCAFISAPYLAIQHKSIPYWYVAYPSQQPIQIQHLPAETSTDACFYQPADAIQPSMLAAMESYPITDVLEPSLALETYCKESKLLNPYFPSVFWHVAASKKAVVQQARNINYDEANVVVDLIYYFVYAESIPPEQITVVTPYEKQASLIISLTHYYCAISVISPEQLKDCYNSVIIVSCVSSNEYHPGALAYYPWFANLVRYNAALVSIFVGDAVYWVQENTYWAMMLSYYQENKALYYGDNLQVLKPFKLQAYSDSTRSSAAFCGKDLKACAVNYQAYKLESYLVPADLAYSSQNIGYPVCYPVGSRLAENTAQQYGHYNAEQFNEYASQAQALEFYMLPGHFQNAVEGTSDEAMFQAKYYAALVATNNEYSLESDNICCYCKGADPDWKLHCGHIYHRECAIENYKQSQSCVVCYADYLESIYVVLFAYEDEEYEKERLSMVTLCAMCQQYIGDEKIHKFTCGHEAHLQCCRGLPIYQIICPACADYRQKSAASTVDELAAFYKRQQKPQAGKKPQKHK